MEALVLGVVALTSIVVIAVLGRGGISGLAAAVGVLLEALGATVLFFIANVTLAAAIVLLSRRLWFYASLYDASDISLLILSFLQAMTATIWSRTR